MAKTKNKATSNEVDTKRVSSETENELRTLISLLNVRVDAINNRIDRIVAALGKSKSVRGL